MAMVFYLATHKEPGHPTQGAGNSGIYFSALQGTSGTSTINRMDKTSHALLWQHAVDGLDSFVIAGDALYVSAYDQDTGHGYVYALNAKNGSVRWRADLGPHDFLTTPAVGDGAVYDMQWTGKIYALNISDGKTNWVYDTKHTPNVSGGLARPGEVAVADGTVYDTILNTLFAVDGKKGTLNWSKHIDSNYAYGSPHVVGGVVYLSSSGPLNNYQVGQQSGFVYAYDAKSGNQDWVHPVGNPGPSDPTIANGLVLYSATNIYALNASDGQEVWQYSVGQELISSPYAADGVVYEREDGIIHEGLSPVTVKPALLALTLTTGKKLWSQPIDVYIGTVQDGVIYAGLVPRQLATFRTTDGALLWRQQVEGQNGFPDGAPVIRAVP
jgi:outer membrane protein assembly factor BamB